MSDLNILPCLQDLSTLSISEFDFDGVFITHLVSLRDFPVILAGHELSLNLLVAGNIKVKATVRLCDLCDERGNCGALHQPQLFEAFFDRITGSGYDHHSIRIVIQLR